MAFVTRSQGLFFKQMKRQNFYWFIHTCLDSQFLKTARSVNLFVNMGALPAVEIQYKYLEGISTYKDKRLTGKPR